ncbi:hypothetical protein FHL15_002115 [Xylaria flabelliformis]|uniref:Cell wall protein n=1 Tax=Xylaria flabelliformis TaxID=2512241 RepID=A0A553I9D3_9PEZI|nr:hypothetical protein FHL15_002115 [Xylaria flabelliformis]
MKVNTLITLTAAGMAQASVVRRDVSVVSQLLQDIFQSMTNADNSLLNFENDPAALHEAGFALLDTLEGSAQAAEAMPALSVEDVVGIADASYQCSSIGTKFLTDLQAAAPVFAAHGVCNFAYQFSLNFAEASNKLFEVNKAKFPAQAQPMAAEEISAKNALFTQVQAALAPGACVNQVEPGNEPTPGTPSLPDTEPSASTSVAYHTGTGLPAKPTPPPGDQLGGGQPAGNQTGDGHHNGTHSGQPPKPVIGSARILGSSWSLAMLSVAAGVFMLS